MSADHVTLRQQVLLKITEYGPLQTGEPAEPRAPGGRGFRQALNIR